MATLWIVTRDNVDHVAEQTGYTVEELERILDAYQKHDGRTTVRVAKKPEDKALRFREF